MSRYIREIDLQLPEGEVQGLIDGCLKENGFYRDEWQGKICWTADYGMNTAVSPLRVSEANTRIYFFDYTYENGKLHFEAWVKDGKTKEKGLTGWYLWQLKTPYANLVSSLEKELIDKLPQDSALRLQAEDSVRLENSSRRMNKAYLLLGIVGILVLITTFFSVVNRISELFGF